LKKHIEAYLNVEIYFSLLSGYDAKNTSVTDRLCHCIGIVVPPRRHSSANSMALLCQAYGKK